MSSAEPDGDGAERKTYRHETAAKRAEDTPSDHDIKRPVRLGNVRTTTLPAWTDEEIRQIVGRLPR